MNKPNLQAVQKYFSNVKTIVCLINDMKIDVTGNVEFEYDEEANLWTSIGGEVVFWKDGQFAEITNKISNKPCKCENCNCNKGKTVKRNHKK